jgi:undecaprenyl-diphosphatase
MECLGDSILCPSTSVLTMSFFHAIFIAILQGATELFPISSLGHAVIMPRVMGWKLDQSTPEFLPFLVVLHLGTASALVAYFWRDWAGFFMAILGRGESEEVIKQRKIFGLVCVATLPAVILGFIFEHPLRELFGAPALAAFFLVVNGCILYIGDRLKQAGFRTIDHIGVKNALIIGACQALALIPGLSRSGTTMVGGVLSGLTHEESARFSFLLATPVIAGAGVLEVPKLLALHDSATFSLGIVLTAGVVAGITAFISTVILMAYFKERELGALKPFAYYCWAIGAIALLLMDMSS